MSATDDGAAVPPGETSGEDDLVLAHDVGAVRVLTLNNPARRNAWSHAMEFRYFERLDEADRDPSVRVIVVTGAGKTFCPGLDAAALTRTAGAGKFALANRRPQTYPLRIRKPMLAAINGGCAGFGLAQALNCDVRFAASRARFSTAYARRGLPAEYGTSWLLPRLVGVEHALDLLLSGRVLDAPEALEIGLVSRVVEPEALMGTVLAYAEDMATNCSPRSLAAIRRQVYDDLSRRFDDAVVATLAIMRDFAGNPDFVEGVAAFRDQRPPRFPGLDPDFKLDSELGY